MNKVILMGNLTDDPKVKTHRDNSFTVFTVAVQDGYGDKKKTYFFDCIASGKTGENIDKYFEKGKPILVEGKLYTRKNDEGYEEIKVSIYGFSFINGGGDGKKKSKGKGKGGNKGRKKRDEDYDDDDGDDDEDIPF